MGYQKVSFQPGLTIIGQQFTAIGGEAADISSIIGEGLDEWGADFIRIWTGSSYEDYSYLPGATADINGDGTDGWGDEDWNPVEVSIDKGTGMWINSSGSASLTFSGEVSSDTEVPFVSGLNLIAAPQPVAVELQKVVGIGMDDWGADFIRVWNGSSYDDYSYLPGATADINGDGTDGWGDEDWNPVEVTIPAGQGFWLNATGNGKLIFPDATVSE